MLTQVTQAFVLGLSMGPACLGYCSPVCVPYLACEQRTWRAEARVLILFLLGRLAGYTLVGAVVGFAGTLLMRKAGVFFGGGLRVLMGSLLVIYGFLVDSQKLRLSPSHAANLSSRWFGASLGLLTGINLCPPFGVAIAGAAAAGSVRSALVYFWAFFAGTTIYFVPLVILGPLSRREALRQVARVCVFIAGSWMIVEGLLVMLTRR